MFLPGERFNSFAKIFSILAFIITLLASISCTDDNLIQTELGVTPELSALQAPTQVYNLSSRQHVISVRVDDPQGRNDISQVSFRIVKSGAATPAQQGALVDDGTLGDIITKDGVFTAQITGVFAGNDVGEFRLTVSARDFSGNDSNTLDAAINVVAGSENSPPEIGNAMLPASIFVDEVSSFVFEVQVSDANGPADVAMVRSEFFPPSNPKPTRVDTLNDAGINGDATAADGVFSIGLSSDRFSQAADYFFRVVAYDLAGDSSAAKVISTRGVFRFPQAPEISNLVAPPTAALAPGQVVQILITIDVSDPQGLPDIDFVRFRSILPSGREATNSPFRMADDGNTEANGDLEAGDGTYSIIINLPPDTNTGSYQFIFEAKDKSNLFSNKITHFLTVTR
jgi:hypothetical protein